MSTWVKIISYWEGKFYRIWFDDKGDCLDERHRLPNKPAVYALYDGSRLLYIGSTSSLRNRFALHKKQGSMDGFDIPHIKYSLSRRYGDWLMREARLINRLKPFLNRNLKHGGGAK